MILSSADSRAGYENLTMGITPSGNADLHLGHQMTMFELAKSLEANPGMTGFLWIDDREFHTQSVPEIPSSELVSKVDQQVDAFFVEAEKYFKSRLISRVIRKKMSDFFLERSNLEHDFCGQEILALLQNRSQIFGRHYGKMQLTGKRSIRPIDKSSGRGPHSAHTSVIGRNFIVHPEYINANTREFGDIGINTARDTNWVMFYCYCFLRDIVLADRDDTNFLHLYGGDYSTPWGLGLVSKVERNNRISNGLSDRVDFVTSKLIMQDGEKLSKSGGAAAAALDFATLEKIDAAKGNVVDISAV